ncbi:DNA-directed RNA polymerase subunit beta [Paenibacillus oenotherae]|uniref:DNA-directed RNA polymerase subunit beta n=1 Tax=Paenibacillus oenotherae TaxID=1435645 RepID=A0ABS7D508_9BACL|nr:DNA-directed RNA polymerase subunit beta [Paenibacillus oenotherae]MBW7475022.1 DNA-directed RNA polymerase subunit beta [Paenibacillus oenotherae]
METKKETAAGIEGVSHAERSRLMGDASRDNQSSGEPQVSRLESRNREREQEENWDGRSERPLVLRILLWMLLKSIVPILCILILLIGLYIGFVIVGDKPGSDAFKWSTWKHMYDLVFAD